MLFELVVDFMAGSGLTFAAVEIVSLVRRKKNQPSNRPEHQGTLPWSIYRSNTAGSVKGFQCPKCININKNTAQMPICSCDEYHLEHFHYECKDCHFKSILRTADDV